MRVAFLRCVSSPQSLDEYLRFREKIAEKIRENGMEPLNSVLTGENIGDRILNWRDDLRLLGEFICELSESDGVLLSGVFNPHLPDSRFHIVSCVTAAYGVRCFRNLDEAVRENRTKQNTKRKEKWKKDLIDF